MVLLVVLEEEGILVLMELAEVVQAVPVLMFQHHHNQRRTLAAPAELVEQILMHTVQQIQQLTPVVEVEAVLVPPVLVHLVVLAVVELAAVADMVLQLPQVQLVLEVVMELFLLVLVVEEVLWAVHHQPMDLVVLAVPES